MDDQRQNIFAIAGLDGEMYFLVYRWYLFRWGNDPRSTPEVYWESGAASFRLKGILGDNRVEFDYVGLAKLQKFALCCSGPWQRLRTINSLVATLPGTPSDDVVSLPAHSATPSARLSDQAGGRWGSEQISLAGLPWYPDDWYPSASGKGHLDSYHRSRASSKIDVDHAVGYRSAFAFRYNQIEPNWYYCSTPDRFDRVDCNRRHTALAEGPLWRLNKGEAEWKPLQAIPWKSLPDQDGEAVANIWNQVWWSDVHRRWFFWVGSSYGDVYVATAEAAAKLP